MCPEGSYLDPPGMVDPLADTDGEIELDIPSTDDGSLAVAQPIRSPTIDEQQQLTTVRISKAHYDQLLEQKRLLGEARATLLGIVALWTTHGNCTSFNKRFAEDYADEAVALAAEIGRASR